MNKIDTRSFEERRLEGPLADEKPHTVTDREYRELLVDSLCQLLTSRNLEMSLDELMCEIEYGQRPWQSFHVSPARRWRVTKALADDVAALVERPAVRR